MDKKTIKIKALVSFCGTVSMAAGEIKEVEAVVAKDLIKAKYAEEISDKTAKTEDK